MVSATFNTCTSMITIQVRSSMIRPKFLFVQSISKPVLKTVSQILRQQTVRSQLLPSAAMVRRFPLVAVNTRSINLMSHISNAKTSLHSWSPSLVCGKDQNIHLTWSPAGTSSSSTSRTSSIVSREYSAKTQLSGFHLGGFSETTGCLSVAVSN